MHFDAPFLVALGNALGDSSLVDAGITQAKLYSALLQQPSGLFDHFALRGVRGRTFGAGWGRGQGWALLGLLDVLSDLPRTDPAARELGDRAARLVRAMIATQRVDGHWSAVVHDDASGIESSTAAFMVVAFLRAAWLGVVSFAEIGPAAVAAMRAVLMAVDDDGHLGGVSVAVLASTRQSHYARVPRGVFVPWGQGPLVLALAEMRRCLASD